MILYIYIIAFSAIVFIFFTNLINVFIHMIITVRHVGEGATRRRRELRRDRQRAHRPLPRAWEQGQYECDYCWVARKGISSRIACRNDRTLSGG